MMTVNHRSLSCSGISMACSGRSHWPSYSYVFGPVWRRFALASVTSDCCYAWSMSKCHPCHSVGSKPFIQQYNLSVILRATYQAACFWKSPWIHRTTWQWSTKRHTVRSFSLGDRQAGNLPCCCREGNPCARTAKNDDVLHIISTEFK